MKKDSDNEERSHLRLVVSNSDKRNHRPPGCEDDFVPLEELVTRRASLTDSFYRNMGSLQTKAYRVVEDFLSSRGIPYGLDPYHGKPLVLPALAVFPGALHYGVTSHDELLVFILEDAGGDGLCLSLEMLMPFFSEEEAVMEDAFLSLPGFQYGSLFLEESGHDGFLDLIYRLGFPLYPPVPSARVLERLFAIVAREVDDSLRGLADLA